MKRPRVTRRRNPAKLDFPDAADHDADVYYRELLHSITRDISEKLRAHEGRNHDNKRAAFYRLLSAVSRDLVAGQLLIGLWNNSYTGRRMAGIAGVFRRHAEGFAVRLGEHFEARAAREETRERLGHAALADFGSSGKMWFDGALQRLAINASNAAQKLYEAKHHHGKMAFEIATDDLARNIMKDHQDVGRVLLQITEVKGFHPARAKWPPAKPKFPR